MVSGHGKDEIVGQRLAARRSFDHNRVGRDLHNLRGKVCLDFAVFDTVFDVLKPSAPSVAKAEGLSDSDIDALIAERNDAKKGKNFKRSDEIRNVLLEKGILLEDTKDGVRWKRK